jgi:hypothetical protein
MTRPLADQLHELISACFSGQWVHTFEPDEAEREIAKLCSKNDYKLACWDAARGTYQPGTNEVSADPGAMMPLRALPKNDQDTNVLVMHNLHKFLSNPALAQQLANSIVEGKSFKNIIIVLSPITLIPIELEKLFTIVEHPLPQIDELKTIAYEIMDKDGELNHTKAISAASGMTRYEAENAFTLSMVRHQDLSADDIWELKTRSLKKSGLLTLYKGATKFSDLGGLEAIKTFTKQSIGSTTQKPKGILLLGPSGTGKSAFAKALGDETGRPVLIADPGSWKGSLVGETGQKTRQALAIADSMAPCVLFIDEVEKALGGATSAHQGDSGVSADQLGALLTWLNDHESDVYVVCTSNDVSKLPPEFSRAERFDGIFFLDLPTEAERQIIWNLYRQVYTTGNDVGDNTSINDEDWTGAEIRSCCRLASMMDIPLDDAAAYIIPVAKTAREKVTALREWAEGRCLSASEPGPYTRNKQPTTPARRRAFARS